MNRRVAETATSGALFRPRQAGGRLVGGFLGRFVFVNPTQGGVILASLESLALGYIVERLRRRKQQRTNL